MKEEVGDSNSENCLNATQIQLELHSSVATREGPHGSAEETNCFGVASENSSGPVSNVTDDDARIEEQQALPGSSEGLRLQSSAGTPHETIPQSLWRCEI